MAVKMRLTEAMTKYERHLMSRGLKANTIANHRQVLAAAHAIWGDIWVSSVTAGHIDMLFAEYEWSPSTRNLYLSCLRGFFSWCRRAKVLGGGVDPTEGWRNVRVPHKARMRVPVEQFPALLDVNKHPRDRALIAVGLFTFMRGSEIQTLRVVDLDLEQDTLAAWRHKTSEEDTLPVSLELHEEMERWLTYYRREVGGVLRPDWYLIPAKGGNPTVQLPDGRWRFDPNRLARLKPTRPVNHPYEVVQRALAALGYDTKGEGEHTLRRSGARALADTLRDQGYDGALRRVASMLGHRDTRVTEKYIGWELEKAQRNAAFAGKPMFPSLHRADATVIQLGSRHG